jgi:multidrug efflux pump subunit AcrA (membrane-fusion protein)
LAVLLAAIVKYPITVRSPATIRPAGELRIIEASGQGIVKSILVKENQTVAKGEAIAIVDDSQLLTKKSQILDNIRQNQLQISQINAQLRALQTQIAAEANSIKREIASTKADLSRNRREHQDRQNIKQEITQINRDLHKTVIRTLEAGTVLKLEIRNPSQVVQPGQAIAQIAPSQAPLVVKARVDAADISKVRLCKTPAVAECSEGKVIMRISAYPYPDYGTINGAVRRITADAITPPTNSNLGVLPYYEVTIQPDKLHLTKGNQTYAIQSGMEVTADIISKQETVLTFILRKARLLTNL